MQGATSNTDCYCQAQRNFNPRTRAGCDNSKIATGMLVFNFNPRTRAGCDNDDTHQGVGRINFNPRTRAGCDVLVWVTVSNKRLFQSTHPCRVRLMQRPYKWSYYRFQSTHPCRVRHCYPFGSYSGAEISIHAPVQGATFEHSFFQLSSIISIHAPVQGATKLTCRLPYEYDFNPRTRAGCDSTTYYPVD